MPSWTRDPDPTLPVRLLCLPYAGGGSTEVRTWAPLLRTRGVDVLPVVLPGRETRLSEAPFRVMGPLLHAMSAPLQRLFDRPYAVFGHSMGGLIAFAFVRHLRSVGAPLPTHLFLSQRRAPDVPDPLPPLHVLPEAAFLAALQQRYGALPRELVEHPDVLAVFLPALRADFALLETYVAREEPPLPIPITVFAGDADPTLVPGDLEGWSRQTTAAFALRRFPGGHFYHRTQRDGVVDAIVTALGR